MIRASLAVVLIAALTACSSAAAPSPSEDAVRPSDEATATPEPTPILTAEPTPQPTAVPVDPADFIVSAGDVPSAFGEWTGLALGRTVRERKITLDDLADVEGADYAAELEQNGFVSGNTANFGFGLADLYSEAYAFDNPAGAAAHQEHWAAALMDSGCTDAGDVAAGIGDVASVLSCPAIGPVDRTAWITFVLDSIVVTLRVKSLDGTSDPNLDLLAEIARNLEARVAA